MARRCSMPSLVRTSSTTLAASGELKQAEEVERLQVLLAVRLVLVNSVGPMLLMQMAYAGGGS
jgi:hypothetical protein